MHNSGDFLWTVERCDRLLAMRGEGKTSRYIAVELGCTRNAVIGKAKRLGCERLKSVGRPRSVRVHRALGDAKRVRFKQPPQFQWQAAPPPIEPLHVPYNDNHQCAAIVSGDGEPATCCGHDRMAGSSYCGAHHSSFHMRLGPR